MAAQGLLPMMLERAAQTRQSFDGIGLCVKMLLHLVYAAGRRNLCRHGLLAARV
jgi:hypothetical protein